MSLGYVFTWAIALDLEAARNLGPCGVMLLCYDGDECAGDTAWLSGRAAQVRCDGEIPGQIISNANKLDKSVPKAREVNNALTTITQSENRALSSICGPKTDVLRDILRSGLGLARDSARSSRLRGKNFKLGELFANGGNFLFQTCAHLGAAYPSSGRVYPQGFPRSGDKWGFAFTPVIVGRSPNLERQWGRRSVTIIGSFFFG